MGARDVDICSEGVSGTAPCLWTRRLTMRYPCGVDAAGSLSLNTLMGETCIHVGERDAADGVGTERERSDAACSV
jgi:hypothetical protein